MITVLILIFAVVLIFLLIFYNYTDKTRFRIDRQFNYIRGLFDNWVEAVESLLSKSGPAAENGAQETSPAAGPEPIDWHKELRIYHKSDHADVCIRCINNLESAYRNIRRFLADDPEISELQSEKTRIEAELLVFQSIYNQKATTYNKYLGYPILKQCALLLMKKPWDQMKFNP